MLRRGTRLAALIILTAAAAEAKVDVELQPYGGLRTATALGEGYYENDLADRLDVAPGVSFGLTCDFPVGGIGPTGPRRRSGWPMNPGRPCLTWASGSSAKRGRTQNRR